MKSRPIFMLFWGAVLSSIVVAGGFFLFTFLLSELYLSVVGNLVHKDPSVNQALLYIFSQACALGGAGGYLFVLQLIFAMAHSKEDWFTKESTDAERVLVGFLIPIKGVIAGAMAGSIVGGIFFAVGGLEALGHAHLLVLGASCLAGYSEQVLQRIVQYGAEHTNV